MLVDLVDFEGVLFDKDELNGIFGFDIYVLFLVIIFNNVIIIDLSNEINFEVYVDIFIWFEVDVDVYDVLFSGSLVFDVIEDVYKLGDYFVYIFIDEEIYFGLIVFGLVIYGDKVGIILVDLVEFEIGEYYSFNV